MLKCVHCGRDIDSIYQANMSDQPNRPVCEDCFKKTSDYYIDYDEWNDYNNFVVQQKRFLSKKQFKFLMRYAGWNYMKVKNAPYEVAITKINRIIFMMNQKSDKKVELNT